jgi:hypothetical protein
MPFDCTHRALHGADICVTACPTHADVGGFQFARVERDQAAPPAETTTIDVALLDMHHGWPNLGHDALVHAVQNAVCDLRAHLAQAGLNVRVVSYDVRRGHAIPELPGGRHAIYIGTGGPGHLDPALNRGGDGSQGIVEDPAWEAPLFALFDAILRDPGASLFAVCHTFGVVCRWLGVADVVLRGPEKGGKSAGIVENVLTDAGRAHPWFARFAQMLPDGEHFRILDNRLYDLVPRGPLPAGMTAIAHEARDGGVAGDALTMLEVARDPAGTMPRVLAVNHHPEIVNRQRQVVVLQRKKARGPVDPAWFDERLRTLVQPMADEFGERMLHLTSSYTLMAPMRYMLYREVRLRGERLGIDTGVHESEWPLTYSLAQDTLTSVDRVSR